MKNSEYLKFGEMAVYKDDGESVTAIYRDGSVTFGLVSKIFEIEEEYTKATREEFEEFKLMAIEKINSL